ncbi:hypothetical protein AYL99_07851 [Fonsecaea erecta]|uniref:Mitochondrial zinc maintenance protein 1, mitochondrial n=1 Tax=Fonsecaea erecta TaxID=1367422 RepID=A0A178ZH10_9EURO|nr:hypothetical protein AYL99_07851 [Fonsecaea erecta]OAP58761.1 hypothetical protein AYL99_07851 [Fonsecaea erecta]
MALAAYRHVLRATRRAFQDDYHLLHAARMQARTGFETLRTMDPDSEEAIKGIAHAEGVASILRHNVVQGKLVDGSNVIRLNIHEDTEKGDNDTVKNPLGKDGRVKVGGL